MQFTMGTGSVAGGGSLSGNFASHAQTPVIVIADLPTAKLIQLVVPPELVSADTDAGYLGMVSVAVGSVGGSIDAWFSRIGEFQQAING